MKLSKTLYVTNRKEWRAWLKKHHDAEREVWLIYYKRESGRQRIPYDDAVEEALCFGWIDSTVERIDNEKYAQHFTPRRAGSVWSELNKWRVRKLLREGRMTKAGMAKISFSLEKAQSSSEARSAREDAMNPAREATAQSASPAHPPHCGRLQPAREDGRHPARGNATRPVHDDREWLAQGDLARPRPVRRELELSENMRQALMKNRKAWEFLNTLAPSYRRQYIWWLESAKRNETRRTRLKEAIALLSRKQKLGMK